MLYKFTPVSRIEAFANFVQEPVVVVDQSLYRLVDQRLGVTALLCGHARQLCLQIGIEVHFHACQSKPQRRLCQTSLAAASVAVK